MDVEYELRWNFADLRYDQVLKGSKYRQEHMPLGGFGALYGALP